MLPVNRRKLAVILLLYKIINGGIDCPNALELITLINQSLQKKPYHEVRT